MESAYAIPILEVQLQANFANATTFLVSADPMIKFAQATEFVNVEPANVKKDGLEMTAVAVPLQIFAMDHTV